MDDLQSSPVEFDFNKDRAKFDTLIAAWGEEKAKVETRRKLRRNSKNVDEERRKGTILPDETIIPDRTINLNIKRGKAPYVAYVSQAKRLLIITSLEAPSLSVEPLELWFARGMRYPKWLIPWLRHIDSLLLHGGAAVEVVYDPTKPFNCSIEFIPRESLIFSKKSKNLQSNPYLLRSYEVTSVQLEEMKDSFNFDPAVCERLLKRFSNETQETLTIYKVFCKKKGLVYNTWYSQDDTSNYLRGPQIHEIGLFDFDKQQVMSMMADPAMFNAVREQLAKPLPLRNYPIFYFRYEELEDETLLDVQGRAALDVHTQEALTHLVSNTVNATTRASHVYGSADNEPGEDPKLTELSAIKPGVILSRKISFWQPPWPNNIILAVTQSLDLRKAQESGGADFAAMSRKDANKTATELQLAVNQSSEMDSVELTSFSSPFLEVYALCFQIATHQAIFGISKPPPNPELLFGDYNLQPAGDIEVVKRSEDKQNAKEFFNIVQGTPAAEKILSFLIQRFFPDQADEWLLALNSPDKTQLIAQMAAVLQSIPLDELTPVQQQQLQSLISAAQAVVGTTDNSSVPGNSPPAANATPASGNAMQ